MSRKNKSSFQIDIFDKKTSHLIQSITGCKTHEEAIEVAASFSDDTRNIVIKKCIDSEEPLIYISKEQSEYVLVKTRELLGRLKKTKKPNKELQEAIECISWLRRWFYPVINLDNENGSATEKHYRKRYALEDIISLIQQIKFIDYPPSGRYYEFKDGSTCEDWNLEPTIRRKLVEIDHIKERTK